MTQRLYDALPTPEEQLALRQSSELFATDVLRSQTELLLQDVKRNVAASAASQNAVQTIVGGVTRVLKRLPRGARASLDMFAVHAGLVNLLPSGFDPERLAALQFPTERERVTFDFELPALERVDATSPWSHGVACSIPGTASLYLDICVAMPEGVMTERDYTCGSYFVKRAMVLGLIYRHILSLRSGAAAQGAGPAGPSLDNCWWHPATSTYGVTYLENNPLLPLLTFSVASDDSTAGLSLPLSRNFQFRINPYTPQTHYSHPDAARLLARLTPCYCNERLLSTAFDYRDVTGDRLRAASLSERLLPSLDVTNALVLDMLYGSCALADSLVYNYLATDALRDACCLLHMLFVCHGVAPRVHRPPAPLSKAGGAGVHPCSGMGLFSTCALVSSVVTRSPSLGDATDSATALRIVLGHIATSMVLPAEGAFFVGFSAADEDFRLSDKEHAALQASGAPLCLLKVLPGANCLFNCLFNVTLGTWRVLVARVGHIQRRFTTPSLAAATAQLGAAGVAPALPSASKQAGLEQRAVLDTLSTFECIFPATHLAAADGLCLDAPYGADLTITLPLESLLTGDGAYAFYRDSRVTLLTVCKQVEALLTQALVQTGRCAVVSCRLLWPLGIAPARAGAGADAADAPPPHKFARHYRNNMVLLDAGDGALSVWAMPLAVTALVYFGADSALSPLHRGPPTGDAAASASYKALFADRVEQRRFADGLTNHCTAWAAVQSLSLQVQEIAEFVARTHMDAYFSDFCVASEATLLRRVLPHHSSLRTDFQSVARAQAHVAVAVRAAAADCRDLPCDVLDVVFIDSNARGTALVSPVHALGGDGGADTPQRALSVVTGLVRLETVGAWPRDHAPVQCLKTLILQKLGRQLTAGRPSPSSAALLSTGERHYADTSAVRTYLPDGTRHYLTASCLDVLVPLRKAAAGVVFKEEKGALDRLQSSGVVFRLFVALPVDVTLFRSVLGTQAAAAKADYLTTVYDTLPEHSQRVASLCSLVPGYQESVWLAKRWVASHLVPLFSLTHLFVDSPAAPCGTKVFAELVHRLRAGEVGEDDFRKTLEDDAFFAAVRTECEFSHRYMPVSARASAGFVCEEAVELLVALCFGPAPPPHSPPSPQSLRPRTGLSGFRAFLKLVAALTPDSALRSRLELARADAVHSALLLSRAEIRQLDRCIDPQGDIQAQRQALQEDARRRARARRQHARAPAAGVAGAALAGAAAVQAHGRDVFDLFVDVDALFVNHGRVAPEEYSDVLDSGNRALGRALGRAAQGCPCPPVLLRTVYDASGALFTHSLTDAVLERLARRASVALAALDVCTAGYASLVAPTSLFASPVDDLTAVLPVNDAVLRAHANVTADSIETCARRAAALRGAQAAFTDDRGLAAVRDIVPDAADPRFVLGSPPCGYAPLGLILPIVGRSVLHVGHVAYDAYNFDHVGVCVTARACLQAAPGRFDVKRMQYTRVAAGAAGGRSRRPWESRALVPDLQALLDAVLVEGAGVLDGALIATDYLDRFEAAMRAGAQGAQEVSGPLNASDASDAPETLETLEAPKAPKASKVSKMPKASSKGKHKR